MTDDTMTTETATEATGPAATDVAVADAAAMPQRWADRANHGQTNGDRYFAPFITPLLSVGGIIFFVLNLSRVFIAGTEQITLIVASVVTLAVLASASALSAAPKMRAHTLAVYGAVGMAIIMFSGFVAVGHAKEKKEATVKQCVDVAATLNINGTSDNHWDPKDYKAKAGCIKIAMSGPAHTFEFTSANAPVGFPSLKGAEAAEKRTFAVTLAAGTYDFHCTVSGHEAMKGTIVVS